MMLIHADLTFLSHQSVDPQSTAYELFNKLLQRARPFRFTTLPRELRDKVYEYALVDPLPDRWIIPTYLRNEVFAPDRVSKYIRNPKVAFSRTLAREGRRHLDYQPLLQVSQQIRQEADEIYWGKNEFCVELDHKHLDEDSWETDLARAGREMQQWVDIIGLGRLRHLRDLTLSIDLCHRPWRGRASEFRVRLDENNDIHVELPSHLDGQRYDPYRLFWHAGAVKMRKNILGWEGEAIVDYFVGDMELWNSYFYCALPDHILGIHRDDFGTENEWWSTAESGSLVCRLSWTPRWLWG